MKRIKIGIVIINYNGKDDTLECLDSMHILMSDPRFVVRIFLVDNNSKIAIDKSELDKIVPDVVLIQNERNEGFAEGNNIGIRSALDYNSDYIILLNNDTVLVDDSFSRLISKMETESEIGIGGIVNYYYNDHNKIWQAGIINDFKYGKPFSVLNFNNGLAEFKAVDYVPGSSMVIKKEVFEKIGLLDARYFAYFEENDFCMRAKKTGFNVAFLQNTKILHKIGQSSNSKIKLYLRTRNILLFYSTYVSRKVVFVAFSRHCIRTIRSVRKTPTKLIPSIKVIIIGLYDFCVGNFYEGSIHKL